MPYCLRIAMSCWIIAKCFHHCEDVMGDTFSSLLYFRLFVFFTVWSHSLIMGSCKAAVTTVVVEYNVPQALWWAQLISQFTPLTFTCNQNIGSTHTVYRRMDDRDFSSLTQKILSMRKGKGYSEEWNKCHWRNIKILENMHISHKSLIRELILFSSLSISIQIRVGKSTHRSSVVEK